MFLSKRDQAVATADQHEASAAAKRGLVKASAIISALDAGLDPRNVEKQLLAGEVRRRKDLVAAARQDRDGLEALASALSVKRHAAAASSSGDKMALFAGAGTGRGGGGGGGGGGGRRVHGAPLPETEVTRELDNQGVLQLQQQVLEQQEVGVGRLIQSATRQKEIALAIAEELEIQNRMLESLGEDVDRVDKKTRVARKRADKIS